MLLNMDHQYESTIQRRLVDQDKEDTDEEEIPSENVQPYVEDRRKIVTHLVFLFGLSTILIAASGIILYMIKMAVQLKDMDKYLNIKTGMYLIFAGAMCFTLICMALQIAHSRWYRRDENFEPLVRNQLLIVLLVFVLMPIASFVFTLRFIVRLYLSDCESGASHVVSLVQIVFAPAVCLYTYEMTKHRIVGRLVTVVFAKVTLTIVTVTLLCHLSYKLVMTSLNNQRQEAEIMWLKHSCNLTNTSMKYLEMYSNLYPRLFPFIMSFDVVCACLLCVPYKRAKIGNIIRTSANPQDVYRPFPRWRLLPTSLGIALIVENFVNFTMNASAEVAEGLVAVGLNYFDIIMCCTFIIYIVLCVMLIKQMCLNEPCKCQLPADKILLWIAFTGPLFGAIFHIQGNIQLLSSSAAQLSKLGVSYWTVVFNITKHFFLIVQIIFQNLVLELSLSRKMTEVWHACSRYQPALVLLLANFGLWISSCFLISSADLNSALLKLYPQGSLSILRAAFETMASLYRIHSATLFYRIFRNME